MLRMTTALTTVAALFAAPALAGNITPVTQEPVIAAPAPVPAAPLTPNWTGFYAGGQLGYAWVDTNVSGVDGDNLIGGVVLGYDYDFGNWVLGGGLDYDFTDVNLSGVNGSVDEIFRAKLRAGPKIGRGLVYGTGGYAWADSDNLGSEGGWFVGGGYEHMVTDNVSLGAELLYHEFDSFGNTGADVDATTLQARATFRF